MKSLSYKSILLNTAKIFVLLLSLAILASACNNGKPKGVFSIEELKSQNKSPIAIIQVSASMGVGNVALNTNPTVNVEFKNISDRKIVSFSWVSINFDKDGKLCANPMGEGGYAELQRIESGESLKGKFFSSDPKTSKVVIIIKDVIYESKKGPYEIMEKWVNKNLESDIEAAKSRK